MKIFVQSYDREEIGEKKMKDNYFPRLSKWWRCGDFSSLARILDLKLDAMDGESRWW
jgi:hypothetical protein